MEGIVRTDDVLGGEPRLEGRRISVRQIVELVVDAGMPPAEVADQLEVPQADVYRALTYHYENPDEMAAVRERHRNAMDRVAEQAIDPPETVSR